MNLKVSEESKSGLNTGFINIESGRRISLEHAIEQINKGNPSYNRYQTVTTNRGTTYIRSKADGSIRNNIEP